MSSTIQGNYDQEASVKYSNIDLMGQGTLFLSFRDLPQLIQKYKPASLALSELHALDYGCGAGRSTRFLKYLGITQVEGIEVNPTMIQHAKSSDPSGSYRLINNAQTGFSSDSFDLVLSSFVFVEIAEKKEVEAIFNEVYRVLKNNGIFVIVTLSADFFRPEYKWISYDQTLSGGTVKNPGDSMLIKIKDIDLVLRDHYWPEETLEAMASEAGFESCITHIPYGISEDGIDWASEKEVSPYRIMILKKPEAL